MCVAKNTLRGESALMRALRAKERGSQRKLFPANVRSTFAGMKENAAFMAAFFLGTFRNAIVPRIFKNSPCAVCRFSACRRRIFRDFLRKSAFPEKPSFFFMERLVQ